jgi:pilus assembly protein CpaC
VTARLVKPVAPHLAPRVPTDFVGDEPDSFSFFLLGHDQVGGGKEDSSTKRGSSGATGFAP